MKTNRFIILIIAAVMLLSAVSAASAATPTITVDVPTADVEVGETVTVPVILTNSPGFISFNLKICEAVGAEISIDENTPSSLTGGMFLPNYDDLEVGFISQGGITADTVTLCNLNVKVTADNVHNVPVNVILRELYSNAGSDLVSQVTIQNGMVTVAVTLVPTTVEITSPAENAVLAYKAEGTASAVVKDQFGETMTGAAVTWSSSSDSLEINAATGKYTVKSCTDSTAVITASAGTGITDTVTVSLQKADPSLADLVVTPSLDEAQEYDGTPKTVTVTSASGVSGLGTVTVKYAGNTDAPTAIGTYEVTADIAAGDNYNAGTIELGTLNVVAAVPTTIEVTPASAVLNFTENVTFSAVVKNKNGVVIEDAGVTWSIDPVDAGTIANGKFTATAKFLEENKVVTVTARSSESPALHKNVTVTVNGFFATELNITNAVNELEPAETHQLEFNVEDQFGAVLPEAEVVWTTSNDAVVNVSETGLLEAKGVGQAVITAKSGTIEESFMVQVFSSVTPTFAVTKTENPDGSVTFTAGSEVTVEFNNEHNITTFITASGAKMFVFFKDMVNTTNTVTGNVTEYGIDYPAILVAASVSPAGFNLSVIVDSFIPTLAIVTPAVNETKADMIAAKYGDKYKLLSMVEVDSSLNNNLTEAYVSFTVPKTEATKDKIVLLHITDAGVITVSAIHDIIDDGNNWRVAAYVDGFSAYALVKDTTQQQSGGSIFIPSSSGKNTETVLPPQEPTDQPNDTKPVPGDTIAPIDPISPSTQPSESPAPFVGILAGLGVAAAVLRRK